MISDKTTQDPRWKNKTFDRSSAAAYAKGYASALEQCLSEVDGDALGRAVELIETCAANGATFWLAGNGGSAAICDHLVCDFIKGTYHPDHPPVRAVSLTENVALYTAVANDFGFEQVFAFQVRSRMRRGDVLLAVSSSGKSNNILQAVMAAKEMGVATIGLSGFDGGGLKTESDVSLHLDMANYGVVEDGHSALLHMMVQLISAKRDHGC